MTTGTGSAFEPALFFLWFALGFILFIWSVIAAHRHSDTVGFVLTPTLALALTWENLALAVSTVSDDKRINGILSVRGAVSSFIIPLYLVTMFELNYTVHKRRSANFFCIQFDQGHRKGTSFLSSVLRYSMWLFGLGVLLLQITCNAPYTANPLDSLSSDAAGSGTSNNNNPKTARFTYKGLGLYSTGGDATAGTPSPITTLVHSDGSGGSYVEWQDVADIVPWALLFAFSLYTGISLWRYGTTMSTDVRSSALNPWASVTLATIGLLCAWVLSPSSWPLPYATNGMEIVLAASLVITMHLVETNIRTLESWAAILTLANQALIAAIARKEAAEAMMAQAAEERKAARKGMRAAIAAAAAAAAAQQQKQQLQFQQQLQLQQQQYNGGSSSGNVIVSRNRGTTTSSSGGGGGVGGSSGASSSSSSGGNTVIVIGAGGVGGDGGEEQRGGGRVDEMRGPTLVTAGSTTSGTGRK